MANVVTSETVQARLAVGLRRRGFVVLAQDGATSYWRGKCGKNIIVDCGSGWPRVTEISAENHQS